MHENLTKDLNDLIKGTHLAIDLFLEYESKANCNTLKAFIRESVNTLRTHESALEMNIEFLDGEVSDMMGLKMMFADFMGKMKTFLIADDEDMRKKIREGLGMGIEAGELFISSHDAAPSITQEIVADMIASYKYLLKDLSKLECGC